MSAKEYWLNLLENEAPNGSNLMDLKSNDLASGEILEIVNKALDKYEERSKEDPGFYTENRNGVKGGYVSSDLVLAVVGMKPSSKGVEFDTPEMGRDYLKTLDRIFNVCGDVMSSNVACNMLQETGAKLRYEGDEVIAEEYLKLAQNCITKTDKDSYIGVHMREVDASKPFIKKFGDIVSLHPDMAGQVLDIMTKLQNGCKVGSTVDNCINNVLNNIVTNGNVDEEIRKKAESQKRDDIEDKEVLSNIRTEENRSNVSSRGEKNNNLLANFLYSLGDSVAGKKSLRDVINDLGTQSKEKREQLFAQARELFNNFKQEVRNSYNDRTMENKYDMSAAAVRRMPDGTSQYMGVRKKPTSKQQIKQTLAEALNEISSGAQRIATGTKDMAKVLSGEMSWDEFDKLHPTKSLKEIGRETLQDVKDLQKDMRKIGDDIRNSNKVTRAMARVGDGLRATINRLRGMGGQKQPQSVQVNSGNTGRGGFGPNRGRESR